MKTFCLFHLLTLLLFAAPSFGASPIATCIVSTFKDIYLNKMMANYQGREFQIEDLDGRSITLKTGKKLGAGFAGKAYVLDELKSPEGAYRPDDGMVVKIAHSIALRPGLPNRPKGDWRLIDEFAEQNALTSKLSDIWHDPIMAGKSDRLVEGELPFAGIVKKIDTKQGTLLFKHFVKGTTFDKLVAQYGDRIEDWPIEMQESFKDVYDLSKAIYDHVTLNGNKFVVDLFPDNFFWVSDPSQFSKFGLKKPGFVFVEITHLPENMRNSTFHVERGDFNAYRTIIDKFISGTAPAKTSAATR